MTSEASEKKAGGIDSAVRSSDRKPAGFRRLISYVRPYTGWIILVVAASLAVAAIDIWMGVLIQRMVDRSLVPGERLLSAALTIGILTVVGTGCKYGIKYASVRFTAQTLRDLRNELTGHLERLPVSTLEKRHTGDIVSRLNGDISVVQTFFAQHFSNLFYMPVVFAAAFIVLLATSWKLIVFSLVLLPAGMAVTFFLSKPITRLSEELQERLGHSNAIFTDTLAGSAIVKAYNLQGPLFARYRHAVEDALEKGLKLEKRRALMSPPSIFLLITPVLFCIAYGGYLINRGELLTGDIVIFLYMLPLVLQPLSVMPLLTAQMREATGAAGRLFDLLDEPLEAEVLSRWTAEIKERELSEESDAAAPVPAVPVEFRGVTFRYGDGMPALDEVSFRLEQNKTIALVGPSGSGKSTLFKLLCGFHGMAQGGSGTIELYGKPLNRWNPDEWRGKISLVAQDSYLFPLPIKENIAFGKPDASMDDIVRAAKAAYAHDFILSLPDGYDTIVGERGARLSGGQRQRIAIARAILKDAPILLLDEATSALDTESEAAVRMALEEWMRERSVLVAAHRLSTVRHADEVIVLDRGKVAERGNHEDLMKLNGLYARLYGEIFQKEKEVVAHAP